jgi:preprotein translocase subunit SecD
VNEGFPIDDPRVVVKVLGSDVDKARAILKERFSNLRLTGDQAGTLELGLAREQKQEIRDKTINQSIEVIRNRIDEFGVAEPVIASQGADRITVELPGVKDVQRAKDLIGRTAKLEFKIVDDKDLSPSQLAGLIQELETKNGLSFKEGQRFSDYVSKLNDLAQGKIPAGTQIAFERVKLPGGEEAVGSRIPYLLYSR